MTDQTVISPNVPMTTNSLSVVNLDNVIFRIVYEMARITSARGTTIKDSDKTRLDAWFDLIRNTINTTTASESDFHYLAEMPLRDISKASELVENPAIQASMNHLVASNINMRISGSSRDNDSLTERDKEDLVQAVNKAQTYIDDFYNQDNPVDFNQSAPDKPIVSPMQLPTS